MSKFMYDLGQHVALIGSQENGKIIGRAEYETSANHYFIRYKSGDGRLIEAWWEESAVMPVAQ